MLILQSVVVFLATLVALRTYLRFAFNFALLDIPNPRSSHRLITPNGGGVVVGIVSLVVIFACLSNIALSFIAAAFLVLGVADDLADLNAKVKLIAHFLLLLLFVLLGDLTSFRLDVGYFHLSFSGVWILVPVIFAVWVVNAHNFMDGIDGLAAMESLFVFLAAAVGLYTLNYSALSAVCMMLGVSTLAFLISNFPPAKLFMGNSGSYFLGFCIAAMMLISWRFQSLLIWMWLIFYAAFMVDATLTLLGRLMVGQNCFKAHRTHLYQRLSDRYTVKAVLILLILIDLFWLLPIGIFATKGLADPFQLFVLAYSPLVGLYIYAASNLNANQAVSISSVLKKSR
ncbi:MAG: hypothetical protein KUG79_03345 [Pseudomonadales bacterium]|nr:hypothetical protein [Pseudomonadales bacterium]